MTASVSILLMLMFVVPDWLSSLLTAISVWTIGFLVAFLFAQWAFAKRMPTKGDVILLASLHLFVAVLFYAIYGIFVSENGVLILFTPDFSIEIILEILAILLSAYRIKRLRMKSVLGEGMV